MAELVYAFDLKSNGVIHMGSSPISGTNRATSVALFCYLSSFFTFSFAEVINLDTALKSADEISE